MFIGYFCGIIGIVFIILAVEINLAFIVGAVATIAFCCCILFQQSYAKENKLKNQIKHLDEDELMSIETEDI